jgi:hypothetical protein
VRVIHILLASAVVASSVAVSARRGQQAPQKSAANKVVVYKTATCGCCTLWVEHLRANGFQVEAENVSDTRLAAVEREAGIGDDLASCHTAKVGGYVVEGHVPAADIKRMLMEQPAIAGIAAPGMPMGSPGMEQGGRKDPYSVIAFTKAGRRSVFAKH